MKVWLNRSPSENLKADISIGTIYQVYLPAIVGHVPAEIVQTLSAFLDFCYLVRRNVIDEGVLCQIEDALARFHEGREVFKRTGIRVDGFSLPRQHALKHYPFLIQEFGAPNSLCSSITESAHIRAVKKPWCRSNHNQPLGQILLTNQRLDKLATAGRYFASRGLLKGPCIPLLDLIADSNNQPSSSEDEVLQTREVNSAQATGTPQNNRNDMEANQDKAAVDGIEIDAEVVLAKRPGTLA